MSNQPIAETADYNYAECMEHILLSGRQSTDRTGTGTLRVFGYMERYNINNVVPLLRSKEVHLKSVVGELLWFLSGSTNVKDLQGRGVRIWDEWADPITGELPEVYGKQWSRYEDLRTIGVDQKEAYLEKGYQLQGEVVFTDGSKGLLVKREINQVKKIIDEIKTNPSSRRHVLNGWNVATVDEAALPPCHVLYQFFVEDGSVSCLLYQRSCDVGLGRPFNIASAAILTNMIAKCTGLQAKELVYVTGDTHIYEDHLEVLEKQLQDIRFKRVPGTLLEPDMLNGVSIKIKEQKNIDEYVFEDFEFGDYQNMGKRPMKVSV